MNARRKKIYLVERVNDKKQLVTVVYTSSIRQLYKFLEGRIKQGRREMPITESGMTKRLRSMSHNVPNEVLEGEPYKVTIVPEYRKSS